MTTTDHAQAGAPERMTAAQLAGIETMLVNIGLMNDSDYDTQFEKYASIAAQTLGREVVALRADVTRLRADLAAALSASQAMVVRDAEARAVMEKIANGKAWSLDQDHEDPTPMAVRHLCRAWLAGLPQTTEGK